jgi:hypothetical protein
MAALLVASMSEARWAPGATATSTACACSVAEGASAMARSLETRACELVANALGSGASDVAWLRRADAEATSETVRGASSPRSRFRCWPEPAVPCRDRLKAATRGCLAVGFGCADCTIAGAETFTGEAATWAD